MPDINDIVLVRQRILPLIFVIDASEHMKEESILQINKALRQSPDWLRKVEDNSVISANINVGVLLYGAGAFWITGSSLKTFDDYRWIDIDKIHGAAEIGSAFNELDKRLNREAFLNSLNGYKCPIVFFVGDGRVVGNWEEELRTLIDSKPIFRHSTRVALAVDDADEIALSKLVGSNEAVVSLYCRHDVDRLTKAILGMRAAELGRDPWCEDGEIIVRAVKKEIDGFSEGEKPIMRLSANSDSDDTGEISNVWDDAVWD